MVSANDNLCAVPLYSETSFTFYRTDVFKAAGVKVPTEQITYTEFREMVRKSMIQQRSLWNMPTVKQVGENMVHGPLATLLVRDGLIRIGIHNLTPQNGTPRSITMLTS